MSSSVAGSITYFSTNMFISFKWTIASYIACKIGLKTLNNTFNTSRVQEVQQTTTRVSKLCTNVPIIPRKGF